jgi:spermidine synthase
MKQKNKRPAVAIGIKYRLYIAVPLCGLSIMVLQLVGSRMIAPFLGASIVVWTSLIGVIMASLAAGYYFGGRIADKCSSIKQLSAFIAGAALWVVLLAFFQRSVLMALLSSGINNVYVISIAAALLFFSVPGFLLATVPPFVVKLFSEDKTGIGGIAGRVSALSTIGSIAGTFLGGFILISFFSVTVILLLTAFLLFIVSIIIFSVNWKTATALCLAAIGAYTGLYQIQKTFVSNMAIETMYNSLFVAEYVEDGRRIRALFTDSEKLQGRIFVDNPDEMAAEYLRFIADVYINENTESILMLGGGVYVLPRWLNSARPDIRIDIVEIDPGITQVARDFFYLSDRKNKRIFHEDARYFVNNLTFKNTDSYDIIFQDAYGSPLNVPFQLATVEYFRNVKALLSENGVFLLNFIGSLDSAMFSGLYAAVLETFPNVSVFPVEKPEDTKALQNIILTGYKSGSETGVFFPIAGYQGPLTHRVAAFTDSFAPVERYTLDMVR